MSKEEDTHDIRRGIIPQREHAASNVKPVLLEYFVDEHQASFWTGYSAGWKRHGRYRSRQQALRVINDIGIARARGRSSFGSPPPDCKWRIDGVEVEL